MSKRNPSIPWCSNCGSMMPVLAKSKDGPAWFECFECDKPDKISYEAGQERVRLQKKH